MFNDVVQTSDCAHIVLCQFVVGVSLAPVACSVLDTIHLVVGYGGPAQMPLCNASLVAFAATVRGLMLWSRRGAVSNIANVSAGNVPIGHIQNGNVEAAIAALRVDPVFFQPLDRALSDAYYRGGVAALAALPKIPDPFRAVQRFLASMEDMTAPNSGQDHTSQTSSPPLPKE